MIEKFNKKKFIVSTKNKYQKTPDKLSLKIDLGIMIKQFRTKHQMELATSGEIFRGIT